MIEAKATYLEEQANMLGDPPWRPTPEHVAGLFARFDVRPDPSRYLERDRSGETCGCAVGVLLIEACGSIDRTFIVRARRATQTILGEATDIPNDYIEGIDFGFTVGHIEAEYEDPGYADAFAGRSVPEFAAGLLDGVRVRAIVEGWQRDVREAGDE